MCLCKNVTSGRGYFKSQGHNLNKLGRGPQGDNTYQISRLWAFLFLTRFFFQFCSSITYIKHVSPGAVRFWPHGFNLNKLGKGPLGDAT